MLRSRTSNQPTTETNYQMRWSNDGNKNPLNLFSETKPGSQWVDPCYLQRPVAVEGRGVEEQVTRLEGEQERADGGDLRQPRRQVARHDHQRILPHQ